MLTFIHTITVSRYVVRNMPLKPYGYWLELTAPNGASQTVPCHNKNVIRWLRDPKIVERIREMLITNDNPYSIAQSWAGMNTTEAENSGLYSAIRCVIVSQQLLHR